MTLTGVEWENDLGGYSALVPMVVGQFEFPRCIIDTRFALSAFRSMADEKFQRPIRRDGPVTDFGTQLLHRLSD